MERDFEALLDERARARRARRREHWLALWSFIAQPTIFQDEGWSWCAVGIYVAHADLAADRHRAARPTNGTIGRRGDPVWVAGRGRTWCTVQGPERGFGYEILTGQPMTVYIDNMRARYRRMIMCHMIADTDAELHAMADAIGVRRKWFQGDHYDVSASKRTRAVKLGAVEITQRQCAAMVANRRCGAGLGAPETAIAAFNDRIAGIREASRAIVEASR
jgi:hypothetical protein